MFDRLGELVSRHCLLVLLAWALAVVGIDLLAPRWEDVTHDGDFAYLPEQMTSVRGEKLLEAAFPDVLSKSQVALIVARAEGNLQSRDFEVADRLRRRFDPGGEDEEAIDRGDQGLITSVWSYESQVVGHKLISQPGYQGQAVLIVLRLRNEFMAVDNVGLMAGIYRTLDEIRREKEFPPGLELGVTGSAAVGYDYLISAAESISNTETTTIVLVIVILLLVYRAPGLVVVPLVTIGASVWVAKGLVASLAQLSGRIAWLDFKVFSTTEIFIIVILFGAGTDYCLFLISRYREELGRGLEPAKALAVALGQVGDALAASALTTILGLGMMFFADFGKYSNSGPAIALCLVVALVACVTLAPALLRASGRIVFWPFGARRIPRDDGAAAANPTSLFGGLWQRLSRAIVARPGLILVVSLLLVAPLVYEGFAVPITYDLLGELKPDRPSVKGTRLLHGHFLPGETGPVTMLVHQKGGRFDTQEGGDKIARLTRELYELEYQVRDGEETVTTRPILSVRSLTEPLGDPPGSFSPLSAAGRRKLAVLKHPKTKATFLSQAPGYAGKVARFDLIFQHDPFSRESVDLLDYVQGQLAAKAEDPSSPWHGATFDFIGTTAGIRDLAAVTQSDQSRIQVLVVTAVLAILILILRRPMICVYLVFSVLLGYFVTIGVTELFFSWLYGDAFHGLDWKVPLFLFVILIAVGEDYNIYLATRVFEEQKRRGPLEGLRVAVVRTGGIITSCGVIMAGTFASMTTGPLGAVQWILDALLPDGVVRFLGVDSWMMSGSLAAMQQLGFALSLGVLLDTFIIRTILVPAFLALLARRQAALPSANAQSRS
ncbi:MAG: MMPL family transporter [Pirellulales bacterium]|nr:MMPL family transporter [Pirellulales bacterium]